VRCGSCASSAWLPSSNLGCLKRSPNVTPIDFISTLVSDELTRRSDRLLERRTKDAEFRDSDKTVDTFDLDFNKKMNRRLVYELAGGQFINRREDVLFLGPPGTGKSHLAQAIGRAAIQQGVRVLYREAHVLLEQIADAVLDGTRKECFTDLATVPLLIIDDLGMRKLPATAAEDLLELVMRRYERASTVFTTNLPFKQWGTVFPGAACVAALVDRFVQHCYVIDIEADSWRQKSQATPSEKAK
jgi:DNA replication protein DnaC